MSPKLTFFIILLTIQNEVTSFPIYRDLIDKIPGNCSDLRPRISRLDLKTCSCNEKYKTIISKYNDYPYLMCLDQSDAGYCSIYQSGGKITDVILIAPNSPPKITLMNCDVLGCNSVAKVQLWNTDNNGEGKWFDIDSLGKKHLKIVSRNVLSVSNFIKRAWAGHAIRVTYGDNNLCSIIKFKGENTYPFSLEEFKKKHAITTSKPTFTTTLSTTTSTLMPATLSSSSSNRTLVTTRATISTERLRTKKPKTKSDITKKEAKTTSQSKITTTRKESSSTKRKVATTAETKITSQIQSTTQKMTPTTETKLATTEKIRPTSLLTKTMIKSNSSTSPVTSRVSKTTTLESHSSTKAKIKSTTFENKTESSKTTPSIKTFTTRRSTSFNPSTDKLVSTHSRNSTIFYVVFVLLVIVAIACVSMFLARRRVNSKRNLSEIRVKIVDVENEPALEYSNPGYRKINGNNDYDGASIQSKEEDLKEKEYKIDEFSAVNDNHYATPRPSTDKHESQENLYSEIPGLSKDRDESNGLYNNLGDSEGKEKESEYYANMKH